MIISGILTNGSSKPINGTIVFTAKKTTSKVIENTQVIIDVANGNYSVDLLPCDYDVILMIDGHSKNRLGSIRVLADSRNGSLNDYLLNPAESEITPDILQQVVEARDTAKKSEENAKKFAESIDTSTLVKKSGDTMTGNLSVKNKISILNKDNCGLILHAQENTNNVLFIFTTKDGESDYKMAYNQERNSIEFRVLDDVKINGKSVLKTGDYGVGGQTGVIASNLDIHLDTGFYGTNTAKIPSLQFTDGVAASLLVLPSESPHWKVEQLSVVNGRTPKIYYRTDTKNDGKQTWYEAITTANSTVDSNGFYKKASPILRLYGIENIENVDGFTNAGVGLVNDLAAGVTAKRIDVGHYEIRGSLGFAKEGWYIQLPEDANGNKKFFAEYSVNKKNVITVKTYTKKWNAELCEIVAGEPVDITDGRWIDVRLEMPVVESIETTETAEVIESTESATNELEPVESIKTDKSNQS